MPDRNSWATPQELFESWNQEFNFTVDACAEAWNAKLPVFWTSEQDGLAQDWRGHRVWCNPPYGKGLIEPWVYKALKRDADLVVLLLPSRTSANWFHVCQDYGSKIIFLRNRIKFVPPPGVTASSPIEASILVLIRGDNK